jgi:hypothetical protein
VAVLAKIFVLVVAKDDDQVRVEVVELLTRPPHALNQLGAMLPDVCLALIVAPLQRAGNDHLRDKRPQLAVGVPTAPLPDRMPMRTRKSLL